MNISKKFLIVFLIVNICMAIVSLSRFEANAMSVNEIVTQASGFIEKGNKEASGVNTGAITKNFMSLGQILTTVGAGILVAVMTYMGIKYIISPPDKQAALKQQLIGVVASGIVIFGSYGIWKIVIEIARTFD